MNNIMKIQLLISELHSASFFVVDAQECLVALAFDETSKYFSYK